MRGRGRVVGILIVLALAAWGGYYAWRNYVAPGLPDGFARSNGRIEATEINIATKIPGRVAEILVDEGDFVEAGQVLARMDTAVLEAQLREAEAQLARAKVAVETAQSLVAQREAERAAAEAVVAQREAEAEAARRRLARTEELAERGTAPIQQLDDDRAQFLAARAAVGAAKAQLAAAEAAIGSARSQVIDAEAAVDAAKATVERIQADIDDSELRSPRNGRVQFRVAEPGEVLQAGGVVLNMVDLTDVYMTFFLPTEQAGRVALGAEARLVLDAAPQYAIPARITFVSDVAQFTPRTVETQEERAKLMFRVRAQVDPDLLQRYIRQVKTGLPGVAYVRLDPEAEWPPELQNVPQA
ncbi:MAG TPA: HlyD family efflux transporter periplasmic adaptor subunit [Geminicoccaceae bacterium]|nr:HlyD family efflux transporter periplasmic adaptor subunit [Geminicoccaceae bacterium]